jgi:hypothetical protein
VAGRGTGLAGNLAAALTIDPATGVRADWTNAGLAMYAARQSKSIGTMSLGLA